ncbi:MAG: hypothetical protein WDZ93_03125, partial [Candidatus Paceibacterota bacterium]
CFIQASLGNRFERNHKDAPERDLESQTRAKRGERTKQSMAKAALWSRFVVAGRTARERAGGGSSSLTILFWFGGGIYLPKEKEGWCVVR